MSHSSASVSVLNAAVTVTDTANLLFGNITMNDNLILRSDSNNTANLVVSGSPSGLVQGLIAYTDTAFACTPFSTVLTVNVSGPQLKYQWQSSPDSLVWSDIAGAVTHDLSVNVTELIFIDAG